MFSFFASSTSIRFSFSFAAFASVPNLQLHVGIDKVCDFVIALTLDVGVSGRKNLPRPHFNKYSTASLLITCYCTIVLRVRCLRILT